MNKQFLLDIIKKGESEVVEFKTAFDQATIETLVAFANTKGGTVVVGVTNAGKIHGIQIGKETVQQWLNQIKANTFPLLMPDAATITIDRKTIVILSIDEFPVKPVSCRGKYLKRIQNANHQLSIHEISDFHLRSYQTSWDFYTDQQHGLEDISLEKVNQFIALSNRVRPYPIQDDPLAVLKKYELTKGGAITNGCYLLFASGDVLLSTIEAGRFSQDTIVQDSTTIRSDLFAEVDAALAFIRKHLNRSYIITGDKQRTERWDYPLEALREIVVNMIVHRDYMDASDSLIKVFNDRIEFFNPGRLLEGLSIEQLVSGNYISAIRNKQIATVFKEAGIIEKYGSGIKRILEAMRAYGSPDPLFEEIQNGFRVTVFKTTQKTTQNGSEKSSEKNSEKSSEKVLALINKNRLISAAEIAVKIGLTSRAVEKILAKLKANGKIKRIGPDKGGYWVRLEAASGKRVKG